MEMMQLIQLGSSLKDLRMSSSIEAFKPIFDMLGVSEQTGENVLNMLRLQANSDDQLFSEFMKEGGLIRALASPDKRVERVLTPVQCPHCTEIIIL